MAAGETDFQLQNSHHAIEFGRECVRSGIIINGGAAVALIGLIGGGSAGTDLSGIRASLIAFCVGVVTSFVAGMIGYFAQTEFAVQNFRRSRGDESSDRNAITISVIGVLLVCISIGAFCWGVYVAGAALFPDLDTTAS